MISCGLASRRVGSGRFCTLSTWRGAVTAAAPAVLAAPQIRMTAPLVEPRSGVGVAGDSARLAGCARLERQPPADERFHRLYCRKHASRQRWLIMHLDDLSASDDATLSRSCGANSMRCAACSSMRGRGASSTRRKEPSYPGERACRPRLLRMTTCRSSLAMSTRVLDHPSGSSWVRRQRCRGALCLVRDCGTARFRRARQASLYRPRSSGPVPHAFETNESARGLCAAPQGSIRER